VPLPAHLSKEAIMEKAEAMKDEKIGTEKRSIIFLLGKILGNIVDWFEVSTLSIGTAAMTAILIANVIARSFFQSIYFVEEIAEFLIIFVTFVGTSYAARKARHIRMAAFLDLMPEKYEKIFIFCISAVSAVVMIIMGYHALTYTLLVKKLNQSTSALRLPYWYFLVITPVGFFLAGIQYIRTFLKNIVEKEIWLSPDKQSEYEEVEYQGGLL